MTLPDLVVTEPLDFQQEQEARAEFSRRYLKHVREAEEFWGRKIFHALGLPYFWDLPPRERKAIFGRYPPVLDDGSTPMPYMGVGAWNWPQLQASNPEKFDRYAKDFAQLLRDEIQRTEVQRMGEMLREELRMAT